jgi:hypothetical protein
MLSGMCILFLYALIMFHFFPMQVLMIPCRISPLIRRSLHARLFAAPTTSDITTSYPSYSSHIPHPTSVPTVSRTEALHETTTTHSFHVLQSDTHRPPTATHTTSRSSLPTSGARHHQRPITIAFAVFGGIVGLAFTCSFLRCLYSYKKTPARDRIASLVHRHQLHREMEELQRSARPLRRSSLYRPAPPPYFPPPPSYVEADRPSSATSRTAVPATSYAAPLTGLRNG